MRAFYVTTLLSSFWTAGVLAQEAPPARGDRARVEAEARGQAAEADRLLKGGEFAAALPLYEAERASRAALGDRRYEAYAARAVGCCKAGLGDDDDAILAWRDAAKLDAGRDDPGFEGYDWLLIGAAHFRRGRTADAEAALKKALPKLSQAQDRDHEADARLLTARCLLVTNRPAEAEPHAARAVALADALADPERRASGRHLSGLAAARTGRPAVAVDRLTEARGALIKLARAADAAAAGYALAEALIDLGRLTDASAALDAAATGHASAGDDAAAAADLELRAAVLADLEDFAAACSTARRAADARLAAADTPGRVEALVSLASYHVQAGEPVKAAETLSQALTIARPAVPSAKLA